MARLFKFVLSKSGFKSSFDDFMTGNINGLSPSIHKGWLWVKQKKYEGSYEMHFTSTHPLKLSTGNATLAYVHYPDNKAENIFYQLINKKEGEHSLPLVEYKKKV